MTTPKQKGVKTMKFLMSYVIDRNTNKVVFSYCRRSKCVEFVNAQQNPENFAIVYADRFTCV